MKRFLKQAGLASVLCVIASLHPALIGFVIGGLVGWYAFRDEPCKHKKTSLLYSSTVCSDCGEWLD